MPTARGLTVAKAEREQGGAGAQRDPQGEWALSSLARVCVPVQPRAEFRLSRAAARGRPRSPASCLGGIPSARARSCWDAPRAFRHRGGSSVLHAPPGKGQPGAPRRFPLAPLGFRHGLSYDEGLHPSPPLTEVKPRPRPPATSPRGSPGAESTPAPRSPWQSQLSAYEARSRSFPGEPPRWRSQTRRQP